MHALVGLDHPPAQDDDGTPSAALVERIFDEVAHLRRHRLRRRAGTLGLGRGACHVEAWARRGS